MGLQTHPEVVPSRNGLQVCIKTQPFVTLCPTCWLLQCWSRLSCLRDCLAIWLLHTVKWLPAGHTNAGLAFTHSQVATCRPHQRWSRLYSQSSGHTQATPTLVSPSYCACDNLTPSAVTTHNLVCRLYAPLTLLPAELHSPQWPPRHEPTRLLATHRLP